jgi:hypothetical protein
MAAVERIQTEVLRMVALTGRVPACAMTALRSDQALVNVLGVESWGPLTLLLCRDGDPAGVLQRLRLAHWQAAVAAADPQPAAGLVLTMLLRHQAAAFRPLGCPASLGLPQELAYRHRLRACRCGRCLRLRSWCPGGAQGRWRPCGGEQRLDRPCRCA